MADERRSVATLIGSHDDDQLTAVSLWPGGTPKPLLDRRV